MAMAHEGLHEEERDLSKKTRDMHRALVSLQEELEAVDWYRQRADACGDAQLKSVLLHNMRDEMEHAAMLIEWLRRSDDDFEGQLRALVFSDGDIVETEAKAAEPPPAEDDRRPTIGALKEQST
jgi:ferritin-like protein